MLDVTGNIWDYYGEREDFITVITTNASLDKKGMAVMGKGCALEAKEKFPELPKLLASRLSANGNIPYVFKVGGGLLITLPTKNKWNEKSDIKLITASLARLVYRVFDLRMNTGKAYTVFMPKPGCGCGGLDWKKDVEPVMRDMLGSCFVVCHTQ